MWQPIETAPKDGSCVLLYWPDIDSIATGAWYAPLGCVEHWCKDCRVTYCIDPTHWMPLPDPPKSK